MADKSVWDSILCVTRAGNAKLLQGANGNPLETSLRNNVLVQLPFSYAARLPPDPFQKHQTFKFCNLI